MANETTTSDTPLNRQAQPVPKNQSAWAELTAKYLRDLPRQLDSVLAVLQEKNYAALKNHAHRIKGTSGTYRLETICKSVTRLEQLAESKNPTRIAAELDKVRRLIELEKKRLDSQSLCSPAGQERQK